MLVYAEDLSSMDDMFDDIMGTDETEEEGGSDIGSFEISDDTKLSISGDHEFKLPFPIIPDYTEYSGGIKSPGFFNELTLKYEYDELVLMSAWDMSILMQKGGEIDEMLSVRPLENYISWAPGDFIFSFGFQEFAWGTADGQNPTDNINPRDYSEGLESEKLPALSAFAKFYPTSSFSIEAVYLPYAQASVFPTDISSEIPARLFSETIITNAMMQTHTEIKEKSVEVDDPDYDASSFKAGLKLTYLGTVDFSLSYLYDMDDMYTPEISLLAYNMDPDTNVSGNIPAYRVSNISLSRKRLHRIGADMKTTLDRFGVWLEAAYTISEDTDMSSYKLRNHNLSWTAGFDFNYGPDQEFYMNLQYMGSFVPEFDDSFYTDYSGGAPDSTKVADKDYMEEFYYRALVNKIGGLSEGLLNGVVMRSEFPMNYQKIKPMLTAALFIPAIYDEEEKTRYVSLALRPEIEFKPADSFYISLGSDLYFSWMKSPDSDEVEIDTDDKIGMFHEDSHIYLKVNYAWSKNL